MPHPGEPSRRLFLEPNGLPVQPITLQESDDDDDDDDDDNDEANAQAFLFNKNNPTFNIFVQPQVEESDEDELGTPVSGFSDEHDDELHFESEDLSSEEELSAAIRFISVFKQKMNRSVLLAAVSLYGKCRFTLLHYEHLVRLLRWVGANVSLPSASTMRKVIFPRMVKTLFVLSEIKSFPTKKGAINNLSRSSLVKRQSEAVVVLPSSWAKLDIRCLHVLREIVCLSECRCARKFGTQDLRVDSTNHVVERERLSRQMDALWTNKDGVPAPASSGATVKFHSTDVQVTEASQRLNDFKPVQVQYKGALCSSFNARILSTHHICHSADKGIFIETGEEPSEMTPELHAAYTQCLEYLHDLCRRNHEDRGDADRNENEADEMNSETDSPRTRRQRGKRSRHSECVEGDIPSYLVPSDHVTVVQLDGTGLLGVFVSRFWVRRLDDERNIFLFFEHDHDGNLSHLPATTLGAPAFVKEPSPASRTSRPGRSCQTT